MTSSLIGGTTCEEGNIQLTNRDTEEYSLVEMCRSGRWAAICDNEWTMEDMNVICVQAGNATSGTCTLISVGGMEYRCTYWAAISCADRHVIVLIISFAASGHRMRESIMTATEVPMCTGNETSLSQCFVVVPDNTSCGHLEIQCTNTDSSGSGNNTFPVVGVVVGVVFALLLAAVILGAGVLVGAVVWKRRRRGSVKPLGSSKQNVYVCHYALK